MKKMEDYVRSIPDFPEPGIIFRAVTIITGNGARAANGNPYGFSYLTTTVLNWTCPAQRIEKEGSHHEHPCQ